MKRISVRLSDKTHDELTHLCDTFGTRKSEVVRNAIIALLHSRRDCFSCHNYMNSDEANTVESCNWSKQHPMPTYHKPEYIVKPFDMDEVRALIDAKATD